MPLVEYLNQSGDLKKRKIYLNTSDKGISKNGGTLIYYTLENTEIIWHKKNRFKKAVEQKL